MPRLAFAAALLVLLAACNSARERGPGRDIATSGMAGPATDTAALAAIDKVAAQFMAAYDRQDAAAIAALHTDNVRFISGGTVDEGRAKLEEGWKNMLPDLSELKITTLERVVSGDLAAETIRFTQQYRNRGQLETDSGYAVSVLRRNSDGQWRYHTHAVSRVPAKR